MQFLSPFTVHCTFCTFSFGFGINWHSALEAQIANIYNIIIQSLTLQSGSLGWLGDLYSLPPLLLPGFLQLCPSSCATSFPTAPIFIRVTFSSFIPCVILLPSASYPSLLLALLFPPPAPPSLLLYCLAAETCFLLVCPSLL